MSTCKCIRSPISFWGFIYYVPRCEFSKKSRKSDFPPFRNLFTTFHVVDSHKTRETFEVIHEKYKRNTNKNGARSVPGFSVVFYVQTLMKPLWLYIPARESRRGNPRVLLCKIQRGSHTKVLLNKR